MIENRTRLLWTSFLTLITAGIGFAVRGGLLGEWSTAYGFTKTELGTITGGGLLGFGIVILVAGFLIDTFGYRKLLLAALLCHFNSAALLFFARPVFNSLGKLATYDLLWWSAIIFAVGNGLCEAVINPLIATIYPEEKTRYLNILHAGWPGGLVLGGLIALMVGEVSWQILLATYLVPATLYGFLVLSEKFPQTEVQKGETSYFGMLNNCLTLFFVLLLITQVMVGYVELGTDSWIAKITGNILDNPRRGIMLFIYTSTLMFVLRFFAGSIVHCVSSLGLLFGCACVGSLGLVLIGRAEGPVTMVIAVTIYGLGKTFLWPTMLGVVGERFPKSATVAMALLGFVGTTSAGALGGPGIGYKQDRFASEELAELSPETYERFQAEEMNRFLFFKAVHGLDGRKVGVVLDDGTALGQERQIAEASGSWDSTEMSPLRSLDQWWQDNKQHSAVDRPAVSEAELFGSREAIKVTALIPVTMAICYLVMIKWFPMKKD